MKLNKLKPRGRPFVQGTDPRRHLAGTKSREALDFKAEFKRVLRDRVNVEKLVKVLLQKAEAGIPWAMQEVLDRGLGKAVQFIDEKIENGTHIRIQYRNDFVDPETGQLVHVRVPEIGAAEYCRKLGIEPPKLPAMLDPGPSALAREQLEAAESRRLLTAGDGQGEADEGGDYIDACKAAGE